MSTERIVLTFQCDQDWDEMKPTACGRFCDVCKREVFDLANKSTNEINRLKAANSNMCGVFNIEQVESDLIPLELAPLRKLRYYAAAIAAFL